MLKYDSYDIVLQEIPNEISLCFSITGCQLACEGCHSEHLWDSKNGLELSSSFFEIMLLKYKDIITCVIFMGGEWESLDLLALLTIAKKKSLKVALYTGLNEKQMRRKYPDLLASLDFIKTGKWISSLGGLDQLTTNQLLRDLTTGEILNKYFHH